MGHGFAAVLSIVDDDSEATFFKAFLPGDLSNFGHHVAQKCGIIARCLCDSWNRLLWDQEQVHWRLRLDVAEAKAEVVFVGYRRRDFPGDDLLK